MTKGLRRGWLPSQIWEVCSEPYLGLAGIACVTLLPGPLAQFFQSERVGRLATRSALSQAIRRRSLEVLRAVAALRDLRIFPRLAILSLAGWVCEALVFTCVAIALKTPDPLRGPILGFAVGTLSTLLPSSPGYFGTFDYFASQGLRIAGIEPELAAANALLSHLVIWTPLTLVTIGYFLFHHRAWPNGSLEAHSNKEASSRV